MEPEQKVTKKVAELPRSRPRMVLGVVVTVLLAVALRIVSAPLIGDSVHPVTYLSLVGGGFGATAMYAFVWQFEDPDHFAPIEFWANVLGDGAAPEYRNQGMYLHVTYGALVGSFFPRLVQELGGYGVGHLFAKLPLSLVTGTVFGLGLFVLGLLYALMGFFRLELSGKPLLAFLASHVLYGLVHGFVTGFWLTLLEPLV